MGTGIVSCPVQRLSEGAYRQGRLEPIVKTSRGQCQAEQGPEHLVNQGTLDALSCNIRDIEALADVAAKKQTVSSVEAFFWARGSMLTCREPLVLADSKVTGECEPVLGDLIAALKTGSCLV